jgi:hypothetical protein
MRMQSGSLSRPKRITTSLSSSMRMLGRNVFQKEDTCLAGLLGLRAILCGDEGGLLNPWFMLSGKWFW